MTDSPTECKAEVKQATKYVKETENVAEKYSALTVSKNSSDVNMNVGEMSSAAFTAVPTLKSVKKVGAMIQHQSLSLGEEAACVGAGSGEEGKSLRTRCTAVKCYTAAVRVQLVRFST